MNPTEAGRGSRLLPRILLGLLVLVMVAAVALDWHRVGPVLARADWRWLPVAVALSLLSYLCSGSAFGIVCRAFGLRASARRLAGIGFVTMTANNLITLAGAAGYAVSAALLRSDEVRLSDVLAASLLNSYIHFLVGTTCLPFSLLYLSSRIGHAAAALTVVAALALAVALVLNAAVFSARFRAGLLKLVRRVLRAVLRRDPEQSVAHFDRTFTHGTATLRSRPGPTAGLALLVVVDWLACLAALWACFAALRTAVAPTAVASGFFIGIAAGAASMLPGGLGVQEGSMAGIYALLGVPLATGLLVSVLFRLVYYLLPFAVGLLLYWRIMRAAGRGRAEPS